MVHHIEPKRTAATATTILPISLTSKQEEEKEEDVSSSFQMQHNRVVVERPRDRHRRTRRHNQNDSITTNTAATTSDDSTTTTVTTTQTTNTNTTTAHNDLSCKHVTNVIEGYMPRTGAVELLSSSTMIDHPTNVNMPVAPAAAAAANENTTTIGNDQDEFDDEKTHRVVHTPLDRCSNSTNQDDDDNNNDPPLIFNSLADLMEMAGTLPSIDDTNLSHKSTVGTMIETQLDFAVVDPIDYQQQQNDIFYGITSLPLETNDENEEDHKTTTMDDSPVDAIHIAPVTNINDNVIGVGECDQRNTPTDDDDDDDDDDTKIHIQHNVNDDDDDDDDDQKRLVGHRTSLRERFPKKEDDDLHDQLSYTTEESNVLDSDDDDDDDDDDVLMDALKQHSQHRGIDTETTPSPQPPRTFLLFWNAISQWVTPPAVEFIHQLRNTTTASTTTNTYEIPTLERKELPYHPVPATAPLPQQLLTMTYQQPNDIALSRCHGLMTMVQLQTSRCWKEYMNVHERFFNSSSSCSMDENDITINTRSIALLRHAEQQVATLLRCLDYAQPTPKFNTIQIRALTCLLLDMVLVGTSIGTASTTLSTAAVVPLPCTTLGMTWDEYNYLVQSSILSFRTAD